MSPYRSAPAVDLVDERPWWRRELDQAALDFAAASLLRAQHRLRSRVIRRARHAVDIAARLRRRRPWCRLCGGKRVERYVVIHEPGDLEIRLVVECHGCTRVRRLFAAELELLAENFVRQADELGLPAF
jgi:hypothetical protein